MKLRLASVPLLLCCATAGAQSDHPSLDKKEKLLIALDAGVRALDVYSTHQMLDNGYRELILPRAIADHSVSLSLYSGSVVVADCWLMRRLKRHHPKMADWAVSVDAGQDGFWAVHNLFLRARH